MIFFTSVKYRNLNISWNRSLLITFGKYSGAWKISSVGRYNLVVDLLDNYTYISSTETGIHCLSGGLCDYSILIYTAITAFSLSTKFLLRFPDLLKPYLIVKRLPELDYDSRKGFKRFSLCIMQILLLRSVILERCKISYIEIRP